MAAERFNNELPKSRQELETGNKVYLVRQMITRKFDDRAVPYRLIEKKGDSIWRAKALDDEGKIITVHSRHLRRAEEWTDNSYPEEIEDEGQDGKKEVAGVENGSSDPPVKKNNRTTPEERFLTSISGQVSKSGRIRRGSMYN